MFLAGINPLIYFKEKLKGYYVIGEITDIWNTLYPEKDKTKGLDVCLFIFTIRAGTKEYFNSQEVPLTAKQHKKKFPDIPTPPPLAIKSLDNIIAKYTYINDCINSKRSNFLVALGVELKKAIKLNNNRYNFIPLDLYLAFLPYFDTRYEKVKENGYYGKFYNFLHYQIWRNITEEENEILINNADYNHILTLSSFPINQLKDTTKLSNSDITALNNIISTIPPVDNPFKDFACSFLNNFTEVLQKKKLLKICPICNKTFKYKYNRIYCCYQCAKHKHHLRYYQKHRLSILPKIRRQMQELRACYKKSGIKK